MVLEQLLQLLDGIPSTCAPKTELGRRHNDISQFLDDQMVFKQASPCNGSGR